MTGTSWDVQTVDSAGDVGRASSLAFDAIGYPAIAYYDHSNHGLKYAHWNGTSWDIVELDSAYWSYHNSMVFDASGNPAVGYYNYPACDLRYAHFDGTTWHMQTVYDDGLGTGWGRTVSLTLDSSDNPGMAFREPNVGLRYAHWTGMSWQVQTVDTGYGTGADASLQFDHFGNPAIAYWWQGVYAGPASVRYTHYDGTSWHIVTVESDSGSPSLAFDSFGNPAISYYCGTDGGMKYALWDGLAWWIETVDSNGDVGQQSSLAFGIEGTAAISYYDATNGDLKYASLLGVGPATLYVPDDYPTIQSAVEAARSGDTIIVKDGTYTECVQVNKSLTLRSENGAEKTIIEYLR